MKEQSLVESAVTLDQAVWAGLLPLHHHDPFDRLPAAQAQLLNLPIVSADRVFDRYHVHPFW